MTQFETSCEDESLKALKETSLHAT